MKIRRVGVRELRQNLRRVPGGRLHPYTDGNSALARLLSSGRLPARLDLAELGPPPDLPREISISEALAEQRGQLKG